MTSDYIPAQYRTVIGDKASGFAAAPDADVSAMAAIRLAGLLWLRVKI